MLILLALVLFLFGTLAEQPPQAIGFTLLAVVILLFASSEDVQRATHH